MSSSKKIKEFKPEKPKSGGITKYVGFIIVALAMVGLVFSSVFSGVGGQNRNSMVFGRYGDKEIVYRYDNAFGQAVENEMAKYKNNVELNDQYFNIVRLMAWQQAFKNVAVNTAIAYHLEESGYEPSSRSVDRRIVEYGPYRTNGEFDEEKYRAASDAAKASVRERFRDQIVLETWSRDVLDGQYRSDAQLDFLDAMKSTVRTYQYITVPFSDYPDDEVIRYARDNSELFDRLPVSRITVKTEETANKIMSLLEERRQEIQAFGDLAGEYSEDAYKDDGGSMGPTEYYRLAELMNTTDVDRIFGLETGEIAGPFDTKYGWMIFKVDGAAEPADPEGSIEDIRSYMLQNEVGIIEDFMLDRAEVLRTIADSGESFRDTMQAEGFEVRTTPAFPINYGGDSLLGGSPENSGEADLSGTASSEDFWSAIAPLDRMGEISRPVVLSGSVGLFSLSSSETQDAPDYWESAVDYEIARSRQADFRAAVLGDESKLFVDDFSESYSRIFPPAQE